MCAASMNWRRLSGFGVLRYCDAAAVLAHPLELDLARHEGEEGVIPAEPDAGARGDLGAALPDDDGPGFDELAAEDLDAKHLRFGIAAVAGGAASLLVCH